MFPSEAEVHFPQSILFLLLNKQLHASRVVPVDFLNGADEISEIEVVECTWKNLAFEHLTPGVPSARQ